MGSFIWRLLLIAPIFGGCVVKSDDDDDSCNDQDGDGLCDFEDCAPADPTNDCGCDDSDGDGICDEVDCAPDDPTNDSCECADADDDGYCDDEDCFPDDPAFWECCDDLNENGICDDEECADFDGDTVCDEEDCFPEDPDYWDCEICDDADFDGVCDEDDCYPNDWRVWDCECDDTDGDTVCDDTDVSDCVDDITGEYLCELCTEADNTCTDPWVINYCVDSTWYTANCFDSCGTDPKVYGPVCGAPAVAGQCNDGLGACECWCEDAFDTCVDDWTVRYTREGTTWDVHCGQYCGGTCDAAVGACACP